MKNPLGVSSYPFSHFFIEVFIKEILNNGINSILKKNFKYLPEMYFLHEIFLSIYLNIIK